MNRTINIKEKEYKPSNGTIKVLGKRRNKERLFPFKFSYCNFKKLFRNQKITQKFRRTIITENGNKILNTCMPELLIHILVKSLQRLKKESSNILHSFATHLLKRRGNLNSKNC
jgi:site-specific recombinase XerD